jgi:RimJ/RimL family protein N-acetyltransferase
LVDSYKDINPQEIKENYLQNEEDIRRYIQAYYAKRWVYFATSKSLVKLIHILKDGKLIGAAFVERWNQEADTMHLCELAILPDEQRQGYGTALIETLKTLPDSPVTRIVADTRVFNHRSRQFYRKLGFEEGQPHDPELVGNKNWIGLEWKKALD